MSEKDAAKYREAWFKQYPGIKAWQARIASESFKTLQVRTPGGRLRRWEHRNKKLDGGYKVTEAYNTPVQGGAAEAMLASMALLHKALLDSDIDAVMIATIHDELILDTAERDADRAKGMLETAMRDGFLQIFPDAPTTGLVEGRISPSWAKSSKPKKPE